MTPYGKTAQHAIAAMTALAEVYHEKKRFSSSDLAARRGLPRPIIAKVLTILSQAGLVVGSPGPGGGYSMGRPPEQISLYEVAELFDRMEQNISCPFGPDWCGSGDQCPLHDQLAALREQVSAFLKRSTFALFAKKPETDSPTAAKRTMPLETINRPRPGPAKG